MAMAGPLDPMELLVARAQRGERQAFDELVAAHGKRLEAVIEQLMGSELRLEIEAEDALQETLAAAFRNLGRFEWRGPDSFFRWLAGLARHAVLKAAGRRRRGRMLELARELPATGDSPSKGLERKERLERLQAALARLSPDHREVIRLARLEGLAVKEIARRMGRSEGAVMQLLSRALKKLKTAFGHTDSFSLPEEGLYGTPGGNGGGDNAER
jgi:RNA polymerase sigma-70 factor (ECF subfamily)